MKPTQKVQTAIQSVWSLIPEEGQIFLAVSGGMDSMVMMEAVKRFLPPNLAAKKFHVLHVNHHLRGKESDGDEALVKKSAKTAKFEFSSLKLQWGKEKASQASCRKKREEFFAQNLSNANDRILFAHHLDDQAETIFLRLMRGTGVNGLGGMKLKNGKKLRPFLSLTKKDLEQVANEWAIEWREDSSNQSSKYERNWVRNELFPLIETRRPGFNKKLAAVAEDMAALKKNNPVNYSPCYKDPSGFEVWRQEVLLKIPQSELAQIFSLNRKHTLDLSALLQKTSGKCTAEGVRFSLSAGYILVEREAGFAADIISCKTQDKYRFDSLLGSWDFTQEADEEWGVRSVFSLGEKGKKLFQEEKIPQFFRELIPICRKNQKVYLATPKTLKNLHRGRKNSIKYQPSKLADWFFTPSS